VTRLNGDKAIVLTVKTADCVPVFLFDPVTRASGLVHCGWRGLRDGVLSKAIRLMLDRLQCSPSQLLLHMGPYICPGCYAVGPEVARCFPGSISMRETRAHFDLGSVIAEQVRESGLQTQK
jgi:copper oxidase (laccase) domain-containing protein